VPELGGTVGYELNLFLQDYRKNRDTFDFDFWSNHLRYFLNLSSLRKNPILLRKYKKKIKTDLGTNSGANTGGSYNLEEFAITDEKDIP
jgi:S-DNA-T family DNA segregation ATPase FtsK/SpoIIIE